MPDAISRLPLQFEDEVEIHLLVAEKKRKALTYAFKFRKLNAAPPVPVARGALTVVCVSMRPRAHGRLPHPQAVADKIQTAPRNCSLDRKKILPRLRRAIQCGRVRLRRTLTRFQLDGSTESRPTDLEFPKKGP